MKKEQVQIGGTYVAKVSGHLARVRIDAESRFGGWEATNVSTHRKVRIKSAQRLRREAASLSRQAPVVADLPPQAIDEQADIAGDAAEDDATQFDPARCATKHCRGRPVMTYLERPMCQACWGRHCSEEPPGDVSESSDDACHPTEEPGTPEQENDMSRKKSSRKQTQPQPVKAKARRHKKAATPKANATTPKAKASSEQKPKRVSALDAAAMVLKKAGKPMHVQELIAAMAGQQLWTSPGGKTPHATLYAAMVREARDRQGEARFRKVDRGQFAFNG